MWQEFEIRYGNEDTFREMLRIKRSVQAQYNTQVNLMSAQMLAAASKDVQVTGEALSVCLSSSCRGIEEGMLLCRSLKSNRNLRKVEFHC